MTTVLLGLVAIANLFSKKIATIYGVLFTVALFILFTVSERVNNRKRRHKGHALEEFNLVIASGNWNDEPARAARQHSGCSPGHDGICRTFVRFCRRPTCVATTLS